MIHHYLRSVTLGTGLTALFLLLRCSVPGRDYGQLGIDDNTGSGGTAGLNGEDVLHGSAGQGGLGGEGGLGGLGDAGSDQGGQAGTGPIVVPIPCVAVGNDAGTEDAGVDAGTEDAGTADAGVDPCECVDGFIRAIDADGDGERTRACSVAPGLDCDDADENVTHNSCGGCTALPNAIDEDCLDCGAYKCDGTEAVVCASKPVPVEDPDCRCLDALIIARDTDGDGQGTRLCEANPGIDCNDGNNAFVTNECGGCADLPGAVGEACNECGVYACNGGALACVPSTGAAGQRCLLDNKTRETCVGTGFWGGGALCTNVCYQGNCEVCTPGTFQCTYYAAGDAILACYDSTSYGINWWSGGSCLTPGQLRCDPTDGSCTSGSLFLPRDRAFDVLPSQRNGLPWHDLLNIAPDSEYG